jgi:hypothetical protein
MQVMGPMEELLRKNGLMNRYYYYYYYYYYDGGAIEKEWTDEQVR